jgi:glycosyltransferase involved in cell wall biosynthesis
MNACDVCVLPYKYITTSSAIMLAWTFGRPVIVPAIGAFPELVTPETGILYHPDQPDALALALPQARARSWSESEISEYVRQFDWEKLAPHLASLYEARSNR